MQHSRATTYKIGGTQYVAVLAGYGGGKRGEVLYNRYCAHCHVFGRGVLPDLRRMSEASCCAQGADSFVCCAGFAGLQYGKRCKCLIVKDPVPFTKSSDSARGPLRPCLKGN